VCSSDLQTLVRFRASISCFLVHSDALVHANSPGNPAAFQPSLFVKNIPSWLLLCRAPVAATLWQGRGRSQTQTQPTRYISAHLPFPPPQGWNSMLTQISQFQVLMLIILNITPHQVCPALYQFRLEVTRDFRDI